MQDMKKIFITSLAIITLFTSCSKLGDVTPTPVNTTGPVTVNDITGSWHPVGVSGLNGEPEGMPDYYWYYIFNANSTYADYFSTQTQHTGTFSIGQQKSIIDGKIHSSISFDGSSNQSIITLKNDTLTISDNFTGGSKYFYIRRSN
jgi:hypothetical protein